MSGVNTTASKTRKVYIETEAVVGTYEPITSTSLMVPATSNQTPVVDRGSKLISRSNVVDANAGDIVSASGTYAWSYALEAELQIPATSGPLYETPGYWGAMLLACGFQVSDDTDADGDFYEYVLSTVPFTNNAGTFPSAPGTATINVVQNNNGTSDWVMRQRGCTGVASFSLESGEIATVSAAMKGLVQEASDDSDDLLDTSDSDVSLLGGSFVLNTPLVCKGITLSFDAVAGAALNVEALQSLEINMNSNHIDLMDPTEAFGYAVSPVQHDESPTVSFTFPSTSAVDDRVFAALRSGQAFTIVAELTAPTTSGRSVRFTMPRVEFTDVSFTDVNGMTAYAIEGKMVRLPGEAASSLFSVRYYYDPA
jgi:hypothetical protein